MDNPKILIYVLLVILAIIVILSLLPKKEKFDDCGSSIRFSSPPRKDKRTYGNEYNAFPYNGYWGYQPKEERFLGCLNNFILNCGTGEKCYNDGVRLCKDA